MRQAIHETQQKSHVIATGPAARPQPIGPASVDGKFLARGGSRAWIKGVAYGTFAPDRQRGHFPPPARVASDFAAMARHGINTVRTYTPPTVDLLDCAADLGLGVMVGLPWAQHRAFLDDPAQRREVRRAIREEARRLGSHPATVLLAVGNEIPTAVVRWHGPDRVARYLRELYDVAKDASPQSLVTYVNYPPTEYLEVPFFDVCAFNVYLHRREALRAYLTHLQHIAGPRPLLLAEAGADSLREGLEGQAELTAMQLREAFAAGACGTVAFTWTDEWWRGGYDVTDWAFGLVTADRRPKPALAATARVYQLAHPHADALTNRPSVSVVVCAYNAAGTLDACLRSLRALRYPHVEVIVVDDGSTDETSAIARRHPWARLFQTENRGLAAARNLGAFEARGEIVAYTDADVEVDPDWATYLAGAFAGPEIAAAGGPNVVPADDPFLAQCVARAPGGPTHVMLDDHVAEHVPGCNLAIRRRALLSIGGFNPVFRRAGDDVDVCWRLQDRGWTVAFAPAALVRHRHRASIGAYWRQQVGYGEGELWLRPYHPTRFVGVRPFWRGRIYGALQTPRRVNAGVWGTAAFPSVYRADLHPLRLLPHSARWQLGGAVAAVAGLALHVLHGGIAGAALLAAGLGALAITLTGCLRRAAGTDLAGGDWVAPRGWRGRLRARAVIALLHFLQPLARCHGRVRGLLRPPRQPARRPAAGPPPARPAADLLWRAREVQFWGTTGIEAPDMLERVVGRLRAALTAPVEVDTGWWIGRDVSVPVGRLARVDLQVLVEDHGAGRRLVRASTALRRSPWFATVASGVLALGAYGLATPGPLPETAALAALGVSAWRLIDATRVAALVGRAVTDVALMAGLDVLTPPGRRGEAAPGAVIAPPEKEPSPR